MAPTIRNRSPANAPDQRPRGSSEAFANVQNATGNPRYRKLPTTQYVDSYPAATFSASKKSPKVSKPMPGSTKAAT